MRARVWLLSLALIAAGCGDDDPGAAPEAGAGVAGAGSGGGFQDRSAPGEADVEGENSPPEETEAERAIEAAPLPPPFDLSAGDAELEPDSGSVAPLIRAERRKLDLFVLRATTPGPTACSARTARPARRGTRAASRADPTGSGRSCSRPTAVARWRRSTWWSGTGRRPGRPERR